MARILKPSRLSSLISSTSFPLNTPALLCSRFGRFITSRGGAFFNRHYGYFCTGADTLQKQGGESALVGGHQVRGPEPNRQRRFRIMKDCPGGQRTLVQAAGTLPSFEVR